jgi:hypothetical protein
MMFIRLKVQTLRVTDALNTEGGKRNRRMSVLIEASYDFDSGYIQLDTGEVFTNRDRMRIMHKGAELIGFSLTILPAKNDEELGNSRLKYHKRQESADEHLDSLIHAACFITPDLYYALLTNLRSGMHPSHVSIELESIIRQDRDTAPLEFGWEPDGSGLIWHNERANRLPIFGVEFLYPVLELPQIMEPVSEPTDCDPVPAKINCPGGRDDKKQFSQISQQLTLIRQTVMFIAVVILMAAITMVFRG